MNFELQSTLEKSKEVIPSPRQVLKPLLKAGLLCILASYGLFVFQEWQLTDDNGRNENSLFLVNYLLAVGYFVALLLQKGFRFKAPLSYLDPLLLFLVLGLISCFSLNKELTIFNPSVDWLTGWLMVVAGAMIAYAFRFFLPRGLQLVVVFLLGTGVVLLGYYAIYLTPYYWAGVIGALALGLGLHLFVPVSTVFYLLVTAKRMYREDTGMTRTFVVGILVPVLFALVYLSLWQAGHDKITRILNSYQVQDRQDLPRWVVLSQQIPTTPIFERIVQSDFVYQAASESFEAFGTPERRFEELQRHDPLVVLATRLFGKPELTREERIKIMESRFGTRHAAQERLWSGKHLSTSNVITHAQLYPQYRFSYTEKILSIRNSLPRHWGEEEAIFTFHLPEGSVVTSLSLWINGVEEKGYLTTQSKADSAYKTVVGVEVRDPSVVHWQEGNTVSVRVFPCTPQESRQFKIGVTSPLRLEDGQLVYENIYFDGPSAQNASETTVLRVEDGTSALRLPDEFRKASSNRYERYGDYEPDWTLRLPAPALSSQPFSFAGQAYQMQAYTPVLTSFAPARVYLDLNKAWTEEEFSTVLQAAKHAKVYAFTGGVMTKLTPENQAEIFRELHQLNYSLFPLHLVKDPVQALVISKGTPDSSPNLSDLKSSRFADDFAKAAPKQGAIRFFQLGSTLSPYTKTMKELSLLQYDQGSLEKLVGLLKQKQFLQPPTEANAVFLEAAGVKITRAGTADSSAAGPDHLMRLFAYNHLLQQIGPRYFEKTYLEEKLIEEATQANVVSPLSSLVVLETQRDYERFGIEESKNSLGNASVKSSGAVPEPHEWALIFLVILVVSFSVLKPRLFS
ncbi:XrtN system VIT domain-containing protein [Rufibacter sediminis]|uniref:XrtN system VIT domain-containing protein n=1 Tax=Rufibacter sediminis TaxID=2762756 RepID=A0ABR6VMW3_9BACT|nr:XrtN system VIT domain-containing protein [Rufibacter sediminis]MBC3538230.1 XrtN system VIT domain-containing protein [Rufibacter sediminis]